MAEWITKKDLLREAGISYGQLYRWKRKGLIPESWFVRRSTFTGQETFFPHDAILERIRWIQGMKPDVPLDDLAIKIREPQKWSERLPLDVLLATLQSPAEGPISPVSYASGNQTVTRAEFLAFLGGQYLRERGLAEAVTNDLSTFLLTVPVDWLESPATVLLVDVRGVQGRFLIVQSKEVIWWGNHAPTFQISVSELWSQVKTAWSQIEMTSRVVP